MVSVTVRRLGRGAPCLAAFAVSLKGTFLSSISQRLDFSWPDQVSSVLRHLWANCSLSLFPLACWEAWSQVHVPTPSSHANPERVHLRWALPLSLPVICLYSYFHMDPFKAFYISLFCLSIYPFIHLSTCYLSSNFLLSTYYHPSLLIYHLSFYWSYLYQLLSNYLSFIYRLAINVSSSCHLSPVCHLLPIYLPPTFHRLFFFYHLSLIHHLSLHEPLCILFLKEHISCFRKQSIF